MEQTKLKFSFLFQVFVNEEEKYKSKKDRSCYVQKERMKLQFQLR